MACLKWQGLVYEFNKGFSSIFFFFVAEKCKQCKIYRTMYDMYGKVDFSKKKKNLQTGWTWVCTCEPASKNVHEVETHWLSVKDKVPDIAISKEGHTDIVLEYENTYPLSWFLRKKAQAYKLLSKLLWQNVRCLLNGPRTHRVRLGDGRQN